MYPSYYVPWQQWHVTHPHHTWQQWHHTMWPNYINWNQWHTTHPHGTWQQWHQLYPISYHRYM